MNKPGQSIEICMDFPVSAGVLFEWISQQQLQKRWLSPYIISMPQVGTIASITLSEDLNIKLLLQTIDHPEKLRYYCFEGPENWVGSILSFHLMPKGKTCNMVFRQFNLNPSGKTTDHVKLIWKSAFDKLTTECQIDLDNKAKSANNS